MNRENVFTQPLQQKQETPHVKGSMQETNISPFGRLQQLQQSNRWLEGSDEVINLRLAGNTSDQKLLLTTFQSRKKKGATNSLLVRRTEDLRSTRVTGEPDRLRWQDTFSHQHKPQFGHPTCACV